MNQTEKVILISYRTCFPFTRKPDMASVVEHRLHSCLAVLLILGPLLNSKIFFSFSIDLNYDLFCFLSFSLWPTGFFLALHVSCCWDELLTENSNLGFLCLNAWTLACQDVVTTSAFPWLPSVTELNHAWWGIQLSKNLGWLTFDFAKVYLRLPLDLHS